MNNRHIIRVLCVFAFFAGMTLTVQAQANRTGYFLKGNSYNHRMNPAFQPDRGYLAVPVLGNTSLSLNTNLGVSDFIYPQGDALVTFMHPDVSADDFLSNLRENNNLKLNLDMTLFSLGFYAWGGYNTLDVGFHTNVGANIPKDLFRLMKDMGAENYVLDKFGARGRAYADVAIGHSHKIGNELTFGARLKLLAGAAYAEVLMDRMELNMNGNRWQVHANGAATFCCMDMELLYDENGKFNGIGSNLNPGISGLGIGADFGITYDFSNLFAKGLILSASVNDINYMKWKSVSHAGITSDDPYTFNGFSEVSMNGEGNTLDKEFEAVGEDLGDLFALKQLEGGDYGDFMGATLNVGIEYKMPFYDRLSVGALFTQRFDNVYSYSHGSLVLNFSPLNFLDLAASASVSTYGYDWGAMLNIHFPGFNVFAAADLYAGKVSKEKIPLDNLNAGVMFGVNIPFGKRR